jgi:hypothetical protein
MTDAAGRRARLGDLAVANSFSIDVSILCNDGIWPALQFPGTGRKFGQRAWPKLVLTNLHLPLLDRLPGEVDNELFARLLSPERLSALGYIGSTKQRGHQQCALYHGLRSPFEVWVHMTPRE